MWMWMVRIERMTTFGSCLPIIETGFLFFVHEMVVLHSQSTYT